MVNTGISLLIFSAVLRLSLTDNLIWSKREHKFIRMSTINVYGELLNFTLRQSDIRDFYGKQLKVAYYEETNMIVCNSNGTKFTGIYGDLWTAISQYHNLTLKAEVLPYRKYGELLPNGSYDGLVGLVHRNEAQIMPRTNLYKRIPVKITHPYWRISVSFYIKKVAQHDKMWVISTFSPYTWYVILATFLLLSIAAFTSMKFSNSDFNDCSFIEHSYYCVVMTFSQDNLPKEVQGRSRFIYFLLTFFFWFLYTFFNSYIVLYAMHTTFVPPFHDMKSLISDTQYIAMCYTGSSVYDLLKNEIARLDTEGKLANRVHWPETVEEMYSNICSSTKLYAMFEVLDRFKASKDLHDCEIIPVGPAYFQTWIASGINDELPHKRTFDITIMRLIEHGIVSHIKKHWLSSPFTQKEDKSFESITMSHSYVILGVQLLGIFMSVIIFIGEKIVFNRESIESKRITKMEKLYK